MSLQLGSRNEKAVLNTDVFQAPQNQPNNEAGPDPEVGVHAVGSTREGMAPTVAIAQRRSFACTSVFLGILCVCVKVCVCVLQLQAHCNSGNRRIGGTSRFGARAWRGVGTWVERGGGTDMKPF